MKKVKFNKKKEYLQDLTGKSILCFTCNRCGPWCAWFDIEDIERLKLDPPKNPNGFSLEQFEVYRAVTCKGTPIGELVEWVEEEKETLKKRNKHSCKDCACIKDALKGRYPKEEIYDIRTCFFQNHYGYCERFTPSLLARFLRLFGRKY
jgi:hypothetical protein